MLVLTRKAGQRIQIGSQIVLTIVRLSRNQVRLGIEAPQDVPVYRSEIAELGWRSDMPEPAADRAAVPSSARAE